MKNLDLVKKILKISNNLDLTIGNKVRIKFVKDRPGHDFRYALNSKKMSTKLKWRPKINFEEGLKNTIKWYVENEKFLKNFQKKVMKKD